MLKNLFYIVFVFLMGLMKGQQSSEFQSAKKFFDFQKLMLNAEFKKKFEKEKSLQSKQIIRADFEGFMKKIDSVQNTAFIGALIKVKNREDLQRLQVNTTPHLKTDTLPQTTVNRKAEYPGGNEKLRLQVAELFYPEAVFPEEKTIRADVVFVVEQDGSVTSVKAIGDNPVFNRQAEIAVYLLPEKFTPAMINGITVRYRFRLPLSMNFE